MRKLKLDAPYVFWLIIFVNTATFYLQVTKTHGSEAAFEILAKRRRELFDVAFWGNPDDCDVALSVRATAYALLVYTERGEHMTEPIVRLDAMTSSSS